MGEYLRDAYARSMGVGPAPGEDDDTADIDDDDLADIRPGWVGRTEPDESGLLLAVRRSDGLRVTAPSWPSLLGRMMGCDMRRDLEEYERRHGTG